MTNPQSGITNCKTGILLVNLGSPDAPTPSAVRRYLKEFLWDPRVVNLPRLLWWVILHCVVLPFRPAKTAEAYHKIWTPEGSPLVTYCRELCQELQKRMPDDVYVDYAMRYGKPSIAGKLEIFREKQVENIIVLPLYPQYSTTTTASVYDDIVNVFNRWQRIPSFRFISDYYRNPAYINAVVSSIASFREDRGKGQQLIMSFHGLPKKSIELGDPYYYQCLETAKSIAKALNLNDSEWQAVFQSRFGKAEWLKPYCIEVLENLPSQGITDIDIVCPGFSLDCLETLEEIAITNQAIFKQAGGTHYRYIPALNATQAHVDALLNILSKAN